MSEVEILGLAGVGILAMFLVVRAFVSGNRSEESGDLANASADGDGKADDGSDEAHSATSEAA